MNDAEQLIYNELRELREDFRTVIENFDRRITSLETLRDKALGIFALAGVLMSCLWNWILNKV